MEKRVIETPCGKVIGEERERCVVYTSIPFAKTERFTNPQPIEKWDVFDATARPKNCHQRFEYVDESVEEGNFYYHEFDTYRDCDYVESPMTLNIITPKEKKEKCPVILFVHGGSYENGNIEDPPFGDTPEYAERGIILVSLGYRLNVFGLFDSENYGLRDVIFGCKWAKENIEAFGGNPDNMIIMGQSAGAMSVYSILYSQQLKGIVKGAVLLSGAGTLPAFAGPETKENNKWFWDEVMSRCGCSTIEELKKVDHYTLWKGWYDTKQEKGNYHISIPSIDRDTIPDYPKEVYKKGLDLDIPMIVSNTSQDMFPILIYDVALEVGKRKARKHQSNVYGCFFDVCPPGKCYKAFHGVDLWYDFGNFEKSWRPFDQSDRDISKMMIDYISNFARTQDPNGEGLVEWKPISNTHRLFRWIDKDGHQYIRPAKARAKMLKTTLFDKGPF